MIVTHIRLRKNDDLSSKRTKLLKNLQLEFIFAWPKKIVAECVSALSVTP